MNNLDQIKNLLTEVIKLSDGKTVININFFNVGESTPQEVKPPISSPSSAWLTVPEAAKKFGFSEAFFWQLAQKHPDLKDQNNRAGCVMLNHGLLETYFKEHHHYKRGQHIPHITVEEAVQKAIEILKKDRKELHPGATVPKSLRGNYYTYNDMMKKLSIPYTFFEIEVRPVLHDRLNGDAEYLKIVEEKKAEKQDDDSLVEKAIEILDTEGKGFKSYTGRCNDAQNYMGAKELSDRLGVPYHVFNSKVKPALEGAIQDNNNKDVELKIEDWKKKNVIRV